MGEKWVGGDTLKVFAYLETKYLPIAILDEERADNRGRETERELEKGYDERK
jgi:hypothetical protein